MASDERNRIQDQAALGEIWDALIQGAPNTPANRLDPAFVDTIQRVLALDDTRAPDPEFVQRL